MGNELLIGARRVINEQAKELKESKELELSLEYERYRGLEL